MLLLKDCPVRTDWLGVLLLLSVILMLLLLMAFVGGSFFLLLLTRSGVGLFLSFFGVRLSVVTPVVPALSSLILWSAVSCHSCFPDVVFLLMLASLLPFLMMTASMGLSSC
jgi:hypothetical protein